MGDIAESMLDGTMCAECGTYLGGGEGYPVYCSYCAPRQRPAAISAKVPCNICGKRIKKAGMKDHMRVVHSVVETQP